MAEEMIRDKRSTDRVPSEINNDSGQETQLLDFSSSNEEVQTSDEINEETRMKKHHDRQPQSSGRKRQRGSDAEESEVAKKSTRRKIARNPAEPEEEIDFQSKFTEIGFASPVYPCADSLELLGIKEDVEEMLKVCGLDGFAFKAYPAYPKAAAEFLATVQTSAITDNDALREMFGGGVLTFKHQGKLHSLNFYQINELFGFPAGEPKKHSVDKEDINLTWEILTEQAVLPNKAKSTDIRSPTIAYVRKVIAKTFYCRADSCIVNASDMNFLTIAIKKIYTFAAPCPMQGDRANAGLAYVLGKFLEGFRGTVSACIKKKQKHEKLLVGGIITALIEKAGITLSGKQVSPKLMDIDYLRRINVLTGPALPDKFYYKFGLRDGQPMIVELPNDDLTNMRKARNIRFKVTDNYLISAADLEPEEETPSSKTPAQPETALKSYRRPPKKQENPPCICTMDDFEDNLVHDLTPKIREKLVAELTSSIEAKIRKSLDAEIEKRVKEGIEKGLADLSRIFVKKPARSADTQPRRDPPGDRRTSETTPAPARRPDGPRQRSPRDIPEVPPKTTVRVRYSSNKPPPPRRN